MGADDEDAGGAVVALTVISGAGAPGAGGAEMVSMTGATTL
ncbi:hypothetical protein [Nocardia sp. SYP-A9097]|nr:hypothetical protein [Nocardia sp. SYP-A9097]